MSSFVVIRSSLWYVCRYENLLAGRDSDRQKIEALQKQLADNEADLNLFRRRLGRFARRTDLIQCENDFSSRSGR